MPVKVGQEFNSRPGVFTFKTLDGKPPRFRVESQHAGSWGVPAGWLVVPVNRASRHGWRWKIVAYDRFSKLFEGPVFQ